MALERMSSGQIARSMSVGSPGQVSAKRGKVGSGREDAGASSGRTKGTEAADAGVRANWGLSARPF
ncbi:hypothetical protein PtA15_3A718 [Puccinia triticina]|uniref:Uncharacterized protein n=1 Tax=Puccinia triticina TaxID=208348 RepID=A0ABY7CDQ8_9BASI|nr:uncharacterized protein PtA15_3A718 [Puccinia triticina]WAQ83348.1 hypothetical protein PtA15_3A718 [Puccinia triticina]